MWNFGSRVEWRKGGRVVSSYIDVETTKDKCRILNPTPLDCIAGYIMDDAVGERSLKRLPQRRLNFIYGSISSCYSILNSPERPEQMKQANKLASFLCDLESDRMMEKEEKKKRVMDDDEIIRQKSEEKQVRENEEILRGLESCEALVSSVLTIGMDHINNLKVKELRVLLCYHFGSERLKGIPKKVELVEAVTDLFRRDW